MYMFCGEGQVPMKFTEANIVHVIYQSLADVC